jgi:hypothetical protein
VEATPTPPETPAESAAPETGPANDAQRPGTAAAPPRPTNPYPGWAYPSTLTWPYPWVVAPRPRPDPATVYKPGIWFYLIALAVVAIGLYDSSIPGGIGVGPAIWLAGGLMALIWIVAFIICAGESRLSVGKKAWARWIGIPMLGVLFVGLVSANVPTSLRFQMSRADLDRAAASARAGNVPSAGWIGLLPVDEVVVSDGGAVTFRTSGNSRCGLVSVPGRMQTWQQAGDTGYVIDQLSTNWWTWCEGEFYSD